MSKDNKSKTGPGGHSGNRKLAVRLKTARGRTTSSQLWLTRQLNDPYVAAAKSEGYRSRAVYKLLQIHERQKLFKPGQRIIDLGAAPGGWSQAAARLVKVGEKNGAQVIAIDISPMEPIADVEILELDFMADEAPVRLKALLAGHKANVVLSDMAANTVGHKMTDHIRTMALVETALAFGVQVLAPGGAFVAKVLAGGADQGLVAELKRWFTTVKHAKPPASRKDSSEWYVVAQGFKGRAVEDAIA